MAAMALTYPLITLSTRSQVAKSTKPSSQLEVFRKILKDGGIPALYSGINSALFGIAVTQYIYYYWYELAKGKIQTVIAKSRPLSVGENMLTGAVAGAATAIITNPIWVINTRQVVNADRNKDRSDVKNQSTVSIAAKIWKEEGLLGFFQGLLPALILVLNPVIQFTCFERARLWLQKVKRDRPLSGFDFFLLGAVSKLCATSITYPYIVIKSRMQLKQTNESGKYTSVISGLKSIVKNEGVRGMYKGIESKLLQSVASSAFTFAFKEELYSSAVLLLVALRLRNGKK